MAGIVESRKSTADLGGNHLQDHRLLYDSPNVVRYHDQRRRSSAAAPGKANTSQSGSNESAPSSSGDNTNGDEEEDDNGAQADEKEKGEDEPAVFAPSQASGKGKGKRPAIRIEPTHDDDSSRDDEASPLETGSNSLNTLPDLLPNGYKERTYSTVSNTSLLFGEDANDTRTFPRPRIPRILSHSNGTGLLTYQPTDDHSFFEEAIESFDEDNKSLDVDDEDYSGLAQISDDESDIENVEEQEESFIISEAKQKEPEKSLSLFDESSARRSSLDSQMTADYTDFTSGTPFTTPFTFDDFFAPDAPPSPAPVTNRKFSDASTKRVRFDDEVQMSDSSSSSSSELDENLFPDLFLEQEKIPPSLSYLMRMEEDMDSDDADFQGYQSAASDDSAFDGAFAAPARSALLGPDELEDDSSEAGSSGYESDMGDTTDEDDDEVELSGAPRTPIQKSILHRPSSAPASRAATPRPFQRSGAAKGPTRGVFIHEESHEAIAVTDRKTKTLTFYRPRVSTAYAQSNYTAASSCTSTANNSPRTSLAQLRAPEGEFDDDVLNNTMLNSTDIMLTGGLWGTGMNGALIVGGDAIGPPEAFYSYLNFDANGQLLIDGDEYMEIDDTEDDINIGDFMQFDDGDDDTDEEHDEETDVPTTPANSKAAMNGSTPMAETPLARKQNSADAMLEHFDRAGVTAFRNNQSRFRDIACLPHDPSLRASVSRPIRSGRSAETVMSPLRKRSSMKKHAGAAFGRVGKPTSRLRSSMSNGRRRPAMGSFS
ncbi:hypothetical protein M011DRAFT_457906 [Sporormia fimetaria CBS 119925]|uniref:Uncharacterized protein n=1 Tax=Sporormia fimetaria CBS 119925 TaxID=1340428 RepID=A0A6A6VBL8_9PLEO|nr:hypothetical protein M011DRAFT_457906 [Sporormia fimetaria CBS 119925]